MKEIIEMLKHDWELFMNAPASEAMTVLFVVFGSIAFVIYCWMNR